MLRPLHLPAGHQALKTIIVNTIIIIDITIIPHHLFRHHHSQNPVLNEIVHLVGDVHKIVCWKRWKHKSDGRYHFNQNSLKGKKKKTLDHHLQDLMKRNAGEFVIFCSCWVFLVILFENHSEGDNILVGLCLKYQALELNICLIWQLERYWRFPLLAVGSLRKPIALGPEYQCEDMRMQNVSGGKEVKEAGPIPR